MGQYTDKFFKELLDARDDELLSALQKFFGERDFNPLNTSFYGGVNKRHTEETKSAMDELGVGLTKNEEKAFVKELHSEFKSILDGFVDSTHAPVQKFAKTYSDKFTNLFADIAQDVSAANKLLTLSRVKPQQGESLWNAAHRSFQSKGHSGTNDLGRILDKAVEAKFNAAVDKSSGSIYTSGKGRSRSQDERIGQDRNYIQSKHAELSQQKTGSAFTSPRKMSKNPKDLSFFDYETVGVMGYNDFAITEVAVKRAGQQVQTAFLQLTDDAADAIIKNIETIRTKGVGALGKNADHKQRAIARMLDYSLTDNNTITAMHKNLEGVDLVNEELLSRAETMAKIFKTGQGHDGVQVKNLQMGESGKRGYAMHEKFLNNFLGDSARAGHNIRGYDNAVNKAYGVAGTRDIDTLQMARKLIQLGDKNASTGKYLTSHSLSGLAEWFGVGSSLTGAAHTAGYDVELNELVYKALVDLENNTPISAASKRDIQPKSVAQAVKAYYRKGTRDYKTDANGKIIHADERDHYSANRFFRKGSAVQFDGQFASGEKGYNYYKFTDQETGESMFIQQTPDEFEAFQNEIFGGAGNFVTPKSGGKKGVNVKDAWNYITQSSFGYQSLKSMFKSGKDGKLLIDKNGNPIWKDNSDNLTDFMRSKQQALRNSASKYSTGAGAKAIEAVKRLSELEQQGWAPEELSRVLASTYGVPSDDITIDDLGLGASSGFQRANAIKQYIKRNPDHFTDPERANALIEALDRVGDSGRLSADLANAEKWFMNDLKPEIANQIRDRRNAKYQPSNDLDKTIAQYDKLRGGDEAALKFYNQLAEDTTMVKNETRGARRQREITGRSKPTSKGFAKGSIGESIQRMHAFAKENGIGFNHRYNESGILEFGFFNPNDQSVFDVNGNVVASKMKTVQLPTQNENGDLIFDNMTRPNQLVRRYDAASNEVYTATAQEEAIRAAVDYMTNIRTYEGSDGKTHTYSPFANKVYYNPDDISGAVGRILREDLSPRGAIGQSSIAPETTNLTKSGSTLEQRLFRGGITANDRLLEDLVLSTEQGREAFTNDIQSYNNMLTQLHNYMGLAVNDASVAAEYLKTQDTSWMEGEQDRITKLLDKEIKMSGDSNQNLKEEHAGQLGYTSRQGYVQYTPGGKNNFGRTAEQAWSGTAQASKAADVAAAKLVDQGVAFTDSVVTKEWADIAEANDVDIKTGARYVNYLYGKTTDADIMQAYENIAANHKNENVRNLAKQAISSGLVPSVANDSGIFLGDNTVRQAAQTKREINRTITPEEALELFGEGGDILLKNLDKYNQENGTNFNTFDELIKGMKDGQAITFGDGESGFNVGNGRIPISKHGKPIYRPGDIVDSLTMRADGRFSVAGHTYDPLSSKRYFIGETKLTTTGLNQDASEDDVALRKAVATELFNNENVAFGVDGSGDLNARKVMGDLIGKIKYIQNSLINNNGAMNLKANEAFKQISIGNGRTLGDLIDAEGFWSNNFATGNPEDFASLLNTLINDDGQSNMGALDAFGYKWFGDSYNPNLRAGTLRATDDTPYYETGDKYKWGAKSQQSLRNTLKDIVKYTGMSQEQADAFDSTLNVNKSTAYGDEVRTSLEQTAGLIQDVGNYIDIISPDEYAVRAANGEAMGNYINAADIPVLRYENGFVTDESLEKSWGAIQTLLRDRMDSDPSGMPYRTRVNLNGSVDEKYIQRDGTVVPYSTSQIVLPNVSAEDGPAAISAMKMINAVAGGTGNSTAQIRAGENYLRESHNDVNTKTGTTWQAENAYRLGSSFWSKAKGTNEVGDLLSANTAGSYIIMNKGQMKNALMGYDEEQGRFSFESVDEYINHITNLARGLYRAEEELGVEDKFFKDEDALRAVTDKFAQRTEMPKDFRKSGKLAKMAERLAGYTSVDQAGGIQSAYSLEGMLSRLPILSRYGEHGVKIYSSDKVDHGDVKISQALHSFMNGDFDGDTLRTMLTMFQGKHDSYQKFTEHQDTARALHKWDSQMVREMIAMNARASVAGSDDSGKYDNMINDQGLIDEDLLNEYSNSLPKTQTATIDEAQIKALSNPKIKALAEWASKTDKSFVGHFSNRSYGMRKAMGDAGVDENVADLALAALQTPEQMAISAKHKISKLIAQGEENADPQEIARLQKIIDSVSNVYNAQNEAASAKGTDGFAGYFKALEEAGFVEKGMIKGNPAVTSLAPLMTRVRMSVLSGETSDMLTGIKDILRDQVGIDESEVGTLATQMMRGELSADVTEKALRKANGIVSPHYRNANLFKVATYRQNQIGSRKATAGTELSAIADHMNQIRYGSASTFIEEGQAKYELEGENFAKGNLQYTSNASALDADTAAWERHNAAIEATASTLEREMELERQKTGIAKGEAAAVSNDAKSFETLGKSIEHTTQVAELSGGHEYKVGDSIQKLDATGTGIVNRMRGNAGTDDSAYKAFDQMVHGDQEFVKGEDGLLDVARYGEGLVNLWRATDFGTAVHEEMEALTKTKDLLRKNGVMTDEKLSTMHDMNSIVQSLVESGEYTSLNNGMIDGGDVGITKIINDYLKNVGAWAGRRKKMFGENDPDLAAKTKTVQNLSTMYDQLGITESDIHELSLISNFGDKGQYKIGSTLDFLKFDEETGRATIGDFKTTRSLHGAALQEQLSIERWSVESLLNQIKDYLGANGTKDGMMKKFGIKNDRVAETLFKMAQYQGAMSWSGVGLHDNGKVATINDIELLDRAEVDNIVNRAMTDNPWTAIELAQRDKRAVTGKHKVKHGSSISRAGIYDGLYGTVAESILGADGDIIDEKIADLKGSRIKSGQGHGQMHAGNFFKDLVGDIDDYYALKNKMDNGGELTDEEKSAMGRYRAHIAGATNVLQTIDSDLAAGGSDRASVLKSHGIDENQLSILRQIVQAYTQINQEALKIKSFTSEYQNISNQILATKRQLAALEAEIASQGGNATQAQEAARARLKGDIEVLQARQTAFENKDEKEGGKNKGTYAAIKAKEDETSEEIEKGKEAGAFAAMVAAENKTASEKEAEAKKAQAKTKKAMDSSIKGQTNPFAEAGEVAPTGYTAIDELDSVRTMGKLNKAFTAYGDSIGRYFANFFENAYDPDADVSGLFDRWGTEETDKYNQIKAKYGTDKRGIMWRSKKGILSDDEIAADRDFVKQYKNGLKDGTIAETTSFYDELVKASPDLMPSVGELTPFMSLVDRINMSIADMAPDGQTYKGINVTEDGLADLIKRDGSCGQSAYDMIRADYEEAVSEGRAYKGMLPTEDEINSYLTHQGQMSVLKNVDKSGYANLLKLQESMNQYGALMNESKDGLLDPDQIMQMSDLMSTITSLRSIFTSGDTGEEASLIASKMFAQFDKMGVAASIDGDISQLMYGTIDKDFNKHDSTKALKNHMNTYATLRNKQILGEQLNDNELSQMFESKKAIDAARTNVTNGTLVGDELASTRELLIMWNQIRQAVEGVKGQVSEYTSLTNQALSVDKQIYAIKAKIATEGRSATQAEQDRLTELQKQKAEIEARRAGMKKDAAPEFLESAKNIDSRYGYAQVQAQEKAASDAPILIEKENQEILEQQKQAMKSGIGSQKNYDAAELNILRAQKAMEAAYKSGNQQQIDAAQQQLEGARAQAQIASQHKAQFVAVDANGKIIQTTNENGRPISLEQLKKSGVDIDNMQGMARVWNAESGDWENVKLNAAQTKQYVTEISEQWSKHQQLVGKVHAPVKTLGSLVGEVLGGIKQTTAYLMRTSLVYGIIGKVKQAFSALVQAVKALNKSYVDLRIASGQTDSQMKDTMKIYSQMASEMGKTTQEVAAAANDWLRAGYNAEESAKLIKNSMQLSTVGMIDSAKATEYLISTMKGWKLGVDDMEGVIDKMSELDRNAAISSGDIAEAMSRANVSAQLAGSELNKYMSYITTVSDVSQMSAETVGTA